MSKIILLTFFLILINFNTCNIWDNIYSNLRNPLAKIPEEFKLELFNTNLLNEKSADIYVSVSNNKIKLILYESLKIKNTFENLIKSFVNVFKKDKIDSTNISNKEILNIILEFNKFNSSMTSFNDNLCQFQNLKSLNSFGVKFLINSFDLITFLQETFDENKNLNYFDYVVSDAPVNYKYDKNYYKQFQDFFKLIGLKNFYNNDDINVYNNLDKNYLVFRVGKLSNKLEEINIRSENKEFYSFITKSTIYDKVPNYVFMSKFSNEKCEINTKTIFEIIFENLLK